MSTKSNNVAYFADGHTEVITDYDISDDWHTVWFTLESGKQFVYREDFGVAKFYQHQYERDEVGLIYGSHRFSVTNDIDKIRICVIE